ncbi:hypothetical protein GCM10011505_00470 [Tistrella bauzanensis]|uniref:Aminotransferase class I/classII large domain-containing protein n=1 Tax=Tistrella bauzanensis TaxID=657419 RepID=A0ABQ1I8X7_9PROT|nr:alpha-hydroxyketone-type quorum-sensing autoinducer synthase [Tistrella bauzanensis]GGB23162.1 hypothetical protein GCM10011505_00470 [Tistrella bauzanensis]
MLTNEIAAVRASAIDSMHRNLAGPQPFAAAQPRSLGGLAAELPGLTRRIAEWKAEYPDHHVTVGRAPQAGSIMLANNDYLSLADDGRIIGALRAALDDVKTETFMSGVFVQFLDAQSRYEREMAAFLGAEAVSLCQSGWAANDGLIQAIADAETPVYVDLYGHASLWQGIHSAGARPRPFRHNNMTHLASLIAKNGPGVILVDSVYSTSGDLCPLDKLCDLAEQTGCTLVVDESHGVGVFGPGGAGLVPAMGLEHRVHFRTFSLSKAMVGRGGIVAGTTRTLEYFRYTSRPAIFSSTVLPHEIAGFHATLDAVRGDDHRRARLFANTAYLRSGLRDVGIDVGNSPAPIISLIGGFEPGTAQLRDRLEDHGIFGAVFCAPATPKGRSLVRLTVNSGLTHAELDRVINAVGQCRDLLVRDLRLEQAAA